MNAPITTTASDRSKWIGGSDISAILGISPYRTAVDLWLDKIQPRGEDGGNAVAKRRGTRLEPYIVDMIREEHGITIVRRNERYVDRQVAYFAAEIDAEAETGENIEIKTVHPFKAKEWGDEDSDQLPVHYAAQAMWGLGVTGRNSTLVFALIGDDLRRYQVHRDQETIEAMRFRAEQFWTDYVLPQVRPPFDFQHDATLATLRKLYPGTDGTAIDAGVEHEHWRFVLEQAQAQVSRYEAVVDGAKAHLLAEMGNCALLKFADGKAFRRKEIKTKAVVINKPAGSHIDFRLINCKED